MRSLFLNYETGLLIYGEPEIREVGDWVQGIAEECRLGVPGVKTLRDIGEGVARMLAPML